MRIETDKSAAIAVDYQERLMPVMHEKEDLVNRAGILLTGLKILGVPICITQQYTKGLGMTMPILAEAAGTTDYIEKMEFSAANVVADFIKGKQFVIICGIEAHICILQTIVDLQARGFQTVLVTDCITSRNPEDKKIALKRAREEGAILTTSESLLFELLGEAGTETSKKIQRLIK